MCGRVVGDIVDGRAIQHPGCNGRLRVERGIVRATIIRRFQDGYVNVSVVSTCITGPDTVVRLQKFTGTFVQGASEPKALEDARTDLADLVRQLEAMSFQVRAGVASA